MHRSKGMALATVVSPVVRCLCSLVDSIENAYDSLSSKDVLMILQALNVMLDYCLYGDNNSNNSTFVGGEPPALSTTPSAWRRAASAAVAFDARTLSSPMSPNSSSSSSSSSLASSTSAFSSPVRALGQMVRNAFGAAASSSSARAAATSNTPAAVKVITHIVGLI